LTFVDEMPPRVCDAGSNQVADLLSRPNFYFEV
jgi:hypothetical protein